VSSLPVTVSRLCSWLILQGWDLLTRCKWVTVTFCHGEFISSYYVQELVQLLGNCGEGVGGFFGKSEAEKVCSSMCSGICGGENLST